jgi:Mn2+/Fe2+ NRAMP family transporter
MYNYIIVDKPKKSKPQLNHNKKSKLSSFLSVLKSLRPSLITGAADNDPSAITNYSQAGAKFGFGILEWTITVIILCSVITFLFLKFL